MKMIDLLKKSVLSLLLSLCFILAATPFPGPGSVLPALPALPAHAAQKKSAAKTLYTDGNLKLIEKNRKVYCYVNGKKVKKAWKTIDGNTYYFGKMGAASSGIVKIGKKYYCFDKKGHLRTGFIKSKKGTCYYSEKDGHRVTGWQTIDSKRYYFGKNACYVKGRSKIKNKYYLFSKDGVLLKDGWHTERSGKVRLGSVSGLISSMIADSNNSAFNSIVLKIGRSYINTWCRAHGYSQTSQVHGLSPADNNSGLRTSSGNNVTSVSDCGRFLEAVYNGSCVNRTYSKKMAANLKKITRDKSLYYRSKLPAGIPSSAVCANKTGDLDDYAHDCAIVYGKKTDYIICVMAHVPGRGYSCSSYYRKLSSMVYNFFN